MPPQGHASDSPAMLLLPHVRPEVKWNTPSSPPHRFPKAYREASTTIFSCQPDPLQNPLEEDVRQR